jgi:hypothetical protein
LKSTFRASNNDYYFQSDLKEVKCGNQIKLQDKWEKMMAANVTLRAGLKPLL